MTGEVLNLKTDSILEYDKEKKVSPQITSKSSNGKEQQNTKKGSDKKAEERPRKTKLNPNAAKFQMKPPMTENSSCPNLNTESQMSKEGTVKQANSYRDLFIPQTNYPARKTNLEVSQHIEIDEIQTKQSNQRNSVAQSPELTDLLRQYILKKCSLNNHCNSEDFDGSALDGLTKLAFIQSFQAVEHYGASVSQRIVKKSAYLMGIIRGQESHWNNSRAAAQLEGGALQLLHLPKRLLMQIGHCCLRGNCLPSDFTPEVILSLHSLTVEYAMKAVNAFDSNKRIVAGCRGGVVNRPRFLQRLIENVIQQNPISLALMRKDKEDKDADQTMYSSPKSFLSLLGSNSRSGSAQDSSTRQTPESQRISGKLSPSEKMKFLERELTERIERERRLRQELGNLKVQVSYWEKECHRLNSSITHILQNQK